MSEADLSLEVKVLKAAMAAVIHRLSAEQCIQVVNDLESLKNELENRIAVDVHAPTPEAQKTRDVAEADALRALREIQDQLLARARK